MATKAKRIWHLDSFFVECHPLLCNTRKVLHKSSPNESLVFSGLICESMFLDKMSVVDFFY